jgi:hypothetical protein
MDRHEVLYIAESNFFFLSLKPFSYLNFQKGVPLISLLIRCRKVKKPSYDDLCPYKFAFFIPVHVHDTQ